MQVDFGKNYFELFGLPVAFEVDQESLSLRYRELQRTAHPDRFAGGSEQERRLAVQQASLVNEAFRTLKDPQIRARYMLELKGVPLDDSDTAMDPAFLMEQMELRESLETVRRDGDPFAALDRVRSQIEARERELVAELQAAFDQDQPETLETAREDLRKLQFMRRLLAEADAIEDDLTHEI